VRTAFTACHGFMAGLGVGTAAGIVAGATGSDIKGALAPFLLIVRVGQFLRNCRKPPQLFSKRAAFFHRLDGFVGECQFVPRASFPRFKYAIGRKSLDARIVLLIERRIEIAHHDIQRVVQDEFVIRNRPREAAHNTYV
jgi:hypothetical protein